MVGGSADPAEATLVAGEPSAAEQKPDVASEPSGGETVVQTPTDAPASGAAPGEETVDSEPRPKRNTTLLTMPVNGVPVPIRKYIQDQRLVGNKRVDVAARIQKTHDLTDEETSTLMTEAWETVPKGRLAAEGAKTGLFGAFSLVIVVGFFVIIGALIVGGIVEAFHRTQAGNLAGSAVMFAIVLAVLAYAKWALRGK